MKRPLPSPPEGKVFPLIALNITRRSSLPLGRVGEGLLVYSLPLGRVGEGLQRGFEASYTLLYIYAREVSVVTVMPPLTFVGTNGGGC